MQADNRSMYYLFASVQINGTLATYPNTSVQGLRHYFAPYRTHLPALHHCSRGVQGLRHHFAFASTLLGGHARGMLIGACDLIL